MNKLPLVSVLITNYNNEKFIDRSIQSCINQSYLNNEIIFYDDYSTDSSVEIVKNYKRVKLLDSKRKIFKEGVRNSVLDFNIFIQNIGNITFSTQTYS